MDERTRIKDAFDAVHADEALKNRTRDILHKRFYEADRRSKRWSRQMVCTGYAVACSLFLLLGIGGYAVYFTPVAYISIDINPSIELELNRLDRIITVTPFNEDGEAAVKNLSLKNRRYDDGILTLLESKGMAAYLSGDADISISVASDHEEKSARIQNRVMECTGERYGSVSCHESSEEVIRSAHHAGLSFGKYRAFLELQPENPNLTVEDVKGMSMREMHELMGKSSCGNREGSGQGRHGNGCAR